MFINLFHLRQVYLCLPNYRSMTEGHCLIVPMMHVTQATALDEDVWDEIQVIFWLIKNMCLHQKN